MDGIGGISDEPGGRIGGISDEPGGRIGVVGKVGGRLGKLGGRIPGIRPGCARPGDSRKPRASTEKTPTSANRTRAVDGVGMTTFQLFKRRPPGRT